MRASRLEVLACPSCLGPLVISTIQEEVKHGELECKTERLKFPVREGIPWLFRPDDHEKVIAFQEQYATVWHKDGWGGSDPNYLLNLPNTDSTGRHTGEWRVKARSMRVLLAFLKGLRPSQVLDLGAGMGWLSYHLAREGYDVFALEILRDHVLGLGAAEAYLKQGVSFERILGDMTFPPFRGGSFDAVVCNASLHYATNLKETLQQLARILRPGGSLIILNSPVHHDTASANRAQEDFRDHLREIGASDVLASRYHHFVRDNLGSLLNDHIGPLRELPFDPGRWFRLVRYLKGIVVGIELASFPILVSVKRGGNLAQG